MKNGILQNKTQPSLLIVAEPIITKDGMDFAYELENVLSGSCHIAPTVRNSEDFWQTFFEYSPDIVLISSSFVDVNSMDIVSAIKSSKLRSETIIFLISRSDDESLHTACNNMGVHGIIRADDPTDSIAAQIIDKYQECSDEIANRGIRNIHDWMDDYAFFSEIERSSLFHKNLLDSTFIPLGFNPEMKGTKYLYQILAMRLLGIDSKLSILYEYSAMYSHTTSAAVEKAIRYAIERAWMKGNIYMQHTLFGNTMDEKKGKPTNAEFISTTVEHIKQKKQITFFRLD